MNANPSIKLPLSRPGSHARLPGGVGAASAEKENSRWIKVIPQERRTLAMRVTPQGLEVRIPAGLDPASDRVQSFIAAGLGKLQAADRPDGPVPATTQRTPADLHQRVARWADRLDVNVARVQVRAMRRKWASISSGGNLTLATELLTLPADLVDYVIVHELLHMKIPDHGRGFQTALGCILPDWREQELALGRWTVQQPAHRASASTSADHSASASESGGSAERSSPL